MRLLFAMIACATLQLSGCNGRKAEPASTNQQAVLQGQLPYNPLAWRVITSSINKSAATTSTLYGNDAAVSYARSNDGSDYLAGSVLALVTWAERDDPHWFGAKIPGTPRSVEFVSFGGNGAAPAYSVYRGTPLAITASDDAAQRSEFITHQRAAVMP